MHTLPYILYSPKMFDDTSVEESNGWQPWLLLPFDFTPVMRVLVRVIKFHKTTSTMNEYIKYVCSIVLGCSLLKETIDNTPTTNKKKKKHSDAHRTGSDAPKCEEIGVKGRLMRVCMRERTPAHTHTLTHATHIRVWEKTGWRCAKVTRHRFTT